VTEETKTKGIIVVISGPSGVGKSTICKGAMKRLKNVYLSVSVTSRPKSETEIDGKDYWFVTEEEFKERINNGLFLEYAEVFGNYYGTPLDKTEESLQAGKTVILEIDVEGGQHVKQIYPDTLMIFILPPTQGDLAERITNRGREKAEAAEERLDGASNEIAAAWQHYEHLVINDDLKQAINEVVKIIEPSIGE